MFVIAAAFAASTKVPPVTPTLVIPPFTNIFTLDLGNLVSVTESERKAPPAWLDADKAQNDVEDEGKSGHSMVC